MAGWAIGLLIVYLVLAFGARVIVALRTTGKTGIVGIGKAPAIERLGGGLFFAGVALGAASPVLVLNNVIDPIDSLDVTALHVAGFALIGIGIAGTFVAQLQMGASWRVGVDISERTELITGGLFSLVRNPIYAFMLTGWTGFALLVPTWVAYAAIPVGLTGIEIQVRCVEEPHMVRMAGDAYRSWAARVGRFVPGVGRLV